MAHESHSENAFPGGSPGTKIFPLSTGVSESERFIFLFDDADDLISVCGI